MTYSTNGRRRRSLLRSAALPALALCAFALFSAPAAYAQDAAAPAAAPASSEPKAKDEMGKYTLPDGTPTYNIAPDGTLDWYAYSGYRRYHAECHVCHGPDGMGSSYAPALAESLKTMTYEKFMEIVVNGKQEVSASQNQVMPAFGENLNVMCYIDDLYIYLKARADGALNRVRPSKREDKTKEYTANENQCFGRPN
ncbi:MAG TPA: c-type cytochrome, methanol metabolism-related [Xanthobacteraceae bacterium]|nr:c-type cytochrome, methanol metabolism-related [Xanthobacteraceae bacterium]